MTSDFAGAAALPQEKLELQPADLLPHPSHICAMVERFHRGVLFGVLYAAVLDGLPSPS